MTWCNLVWPGNSWTFVKIDDWILSLLYIYIELCVYIYIYTGMCLEMEEMEESPPRYGNSTNTTIYFGWTITPKKDSNKRDKIWTELDTYNMGLSKTSCLLPNLRTVSECWWENNDRPRHKQCFLFFPMCRVDQPDFMGLLFYIQQRWGDRG